jgi:hypothetical protein
MQPAHAPSLGDDDNQPPPEAQTKNPTSEAVVVADAELEEATKEADEAPAEEVKVRDEEEDGDEKMEEEEEQQRGRKRGRRGGGGGVRELQVMVKRGLLAACMTCPICNRLLRDATTISECLHTCEFLVPCAPFLLCFRRHDSVFSDPRRSAVPDLTRPADTYGTPPPPGTWDPASRCRRRGSGTWPVPRPGALTLEFRLI